MVERKSGRLRNSEARDFSRVRIHDRINMSEDERRNTTLAETEDFSPVENMIIRQGNNNGREVYNQSSYKLTPEDKKYFDALENGDMETARQIIEAQAKKKGYSPDTDYRMSHHAPNASTVDENFGANMADVMDGTFVPKDYWTHPEYYLYSDEERDAYYAVKSAIRGLKNGSQAGITVYRAVHKDVKDSKLRNGDWVTPSRAYAIQHGKRNFGDNYRIIEQTVPLKYLWWDANSIAEWGYDDSNNYAYRNTKNNRKLFDTIVRDYDGNIVPPSKRFNSRKAETYYQNAQTSQELYTPEEQLEQVRREYEGTDEWLKAPNGKATNLTERQWLQVRTENFKKWFGDWESDPEHASEIVDRNGEPLVVYHGTVYGGFSIFNTTGNEKTKNTGAWFSNSQSLAEEFAFMPEAIAKANGVKYEENQEIIDGIIAKNKEKGRVNIQQVYPVFLNIRNPFIFDANRQDWYNILVFNIRDWRGHLILNGEKGKYFKSENEARKYIKFNLKDVQSTLQIRGIYLTIDDVVRAARNGEFGNIKYDGAIIKNIIENSFYIKEHPIPTDDYIVPTPKQIKSATKNNGYFDNDYEEIYSQSAFTLDEEPRFTDKDGRQIKINFPEEQMLAVRNKYKRTKQWLKAPNGEKSNLNERQWLHVRTYNFKKWFGDWENDPDNASKVLDENGEPRIVYHGAKNGKGFSVFDTDGKGKTQGTGAWFTSDPMNAREYIRGSVRENFYATFLNIRNPFVFEANGCNWHELGDVYIYDTKTDDYIYEKDNGEYFHNKEDAYEYIETTLTKNSKRKSHRYEVRVDESRNTTDQIVRDTWSGDNTHDGVIFTDILDGAGYHGMSMPSTVYIIPTPNQVKSADRNNGEFGLDTDEIYSQSPIVSHYHFDDSESEKEYAESIQGDKPENILASLKHSTKEFLHKLRGDFPDLATPEAKASGLIHAREILRIMNRNLEAKTQQSMESISKALKGMNAEQLNIFCRVMLINDLYQFKKFNKKAKLPLNFTPASLKAEGVKFKALAQRDPVIVKAILAENKTHEAIKKELAALAEELGMKKFADKVSRYDFYLLDYARLLKGEGINANYIQAVGEFRKYMLQDIERLLAVKQIRNEYDIKQKLIKKYGEDWQEHIPQGYRVFNPLQARFIHSTHTLTENILDMTLAEAGKQIGLSDEVLKDLRRRLADNSGSHLLVLPKALADTLDSLGIGKEVGILAKIMKTITTPWKRHVLFSPTRFIKYNTRNITGDFDSVVTGNPAAVWKIKKAWSELWKAYTGDKIFSDELREFQKRGGAITIESTQELGDYKQMREFNKLIKELQGKDASAWENLSGSAWELVKKLFLGFDGIQKFSDFREQILRYACYLSYLEQMQKSKDGTPNNWGASVREEVMSIPDVRDRAFKMSNELIGDYDQISEMGRALRDIAVPFYSWIEVNAKRYWQLIKNGLSDNPKEFVPRFLKGQLLNIPYYGYKLGKTYLMINLFAMLISLFNNWWAPKAEDELPPDVQNRPHLTLGHDPVTGDVIYFDRIGSLLDVLEWFGQDESMLSPVNPHAPYRTLTPFLNFYAPFVKDIKDIFNGNQTFMDLVSKVSSSAFSKVVNSFNGPLKTIFESGAGYSFYPHATRPRKINDRGKYIAQSFGLQWPYKILSGESHSNWKDFLGLFLYTSDANEAAYFYTLGKVREYQEKVLGKKTGSFGTTRRGEALRKLKTAIRFDDWAAAQRHLQEYYSLNGDVKGLRTSIRNMNPLHGLNKNDQIGFIQWLSPEDKKYLDRANQYFETMAAKLSSYSR